MSQVVGRIRFTGRAARFLQVLQDFGHVDEGQLDQILSLIAERVGRSDREVYVDLPVVRRFAATFLFGRGATEDLEELEDSVLAEDWPLLFS